MLNRQDFSLKDYNSFNINAVCAEIYFPSSLVDLQELVSSNVLNDSPYYILGEGSNTLFVEQTAPVIIKPNFKGMSVKETTEQFVVTVGASENWHDLVCFCLNQGIDGLENLALIPGSVGASPVQNIGAYGVELSDYCVEVEFFNLCTNQLTIFNNAECQFGYRDSIFKTLLRNKAIITRVVLSFPKKWQANINYQGLNQLPGNCSAKDIMLQVIHLRQSKLPDPVTLPNAGSFFKNPIVSKQTFHKLSITHQSLPHYVQLNGQIKLAAGWLIEAAGLKGFRFESVGVHQHQALVLVNYSEGQGTDVVGLAKFVQRTIYEKFGLTLTPEVRMISSQGEVHIESLVDTLHLCAGNND